MITFHDPRGKASVAPDPYELSHDVRASETTVGLLANGFPDSVSFLEHIGAVLKEQVPGVTVRLWDKGNASIPAPQSMLGEIKASCQVVVAAYGH